MNVDILHRLSETLLERRHAEPSQSYAASLFSKGTEAILKKIGEECTELVMAGKDGKRLNIVWEVTDVWFHTLILLAHHGLSVEDVLQEMRRREGISGIEEKKSRTAEVSPAVADASAGASHG